MVTIGNTNSQITIFKAWQTLFIIIYITDDLLIFQHICAIFSTNVNNKIFYLSINI
jgi:hypothetical protein